MVPSYRSLPVSIALAAVCALLSTSAVAQRVTGQISGVVSDPNGDALPGVLVSVNGEGIVGSQTTISNDNGFYRFVSLPPGSYDLNFALDGFRGQTFNEVSVLLGATSVQDVTLSLGALADAIVVTADTPVVDTTSNEVGSNFSRTWVENAPVQRLSFNDLVAHAPGSLRGDSDSRRTMVFGSSYDENSFQLDGADVNDNFFNEQLAQPNLDAIEEIEILSLGAPAEYGNFTGAVYNIVTRQGSNTLHGDLNFFYQSDSFTGRNTNDDQDSGFPYLRDRYRDATAQLGGALAKDRLWFFLSYQHQEDGFANTGVDPELGTLLIENDRYFGKLNLQINPKHRLAFSYHEDDSTEPVGLEVGEAASTAVTRTGTTPTPALSYSGVLSSKAFVDVRVTGFYGEVFLGPSDPALPPNQTRFLNLDTGEITGGHYYFYDLEPSRTTANAKVSYLADEFLGASHDFRFGVQYNESEASGLYGYNDLILVYEGDGALQGYGYTRVPFSYSGNTEAIGVFADDTVRVNDRLSINVGVRFDSNDAFSKEQRELDENGVPTGVVFPRTDYYTWDYLSPRLGFNYQLTGDGRTVLKGHAGRYHRAIATGEFANVIGPSIKPIFGGFYDLETNSFTELFQLTDNSNLSVDPGYDSPRTDQYILSLERQIRRDMGIYVTLVRKEGREFAAWRDVGGIYEEVTWIDGDFDLDGVPDGTDPAATGSPIPVLRLVGGDRAFVITNRSEMDHEISAASVNFVKRMTDRWSLDASATWLRSEGRTTDSGGDTDLEQRGGLQFRTFGRNPNDFVNSNGRLRGDVPFQLKGQFVYRLPMDFLVAVSMAHRDGANRVRRARVPFDLVNVSSNILAQERGTLGRLPDQTLVDLRMQKDFDLGGRFRVSVIADVFNVLDDDAHEEVVSSFGDSSAFNAPDDFLLPRRLQLGARLSF